MKSYTNMEATIRAIKANMPVRRMPTSSGDRSTDDGDTWGDIVWCGSPQVARQIAVRTSAGQPAH